MCVCKNIYVPNMDRKWYYKWVELWDEHIFTLNYKTEGKAGSAFDFETSGVIDTVWTVCVQRTGFFSTLSAGSWCRAVDLKNDTIAAAVS